MFKKLAFIVSLVFFLATPDLYAGKGGSSSSGGGKSSSSSSSGSRGKGISYSVGSNSSKGLSFSTPARQSGKYSGGSSGGSSSKPPSSPPPSSPRVSPPSSPPASKYSGGSNSPNSNKPSSSGNSQKPAGSNFNKSMSNDAKKVESQKRYEAATAPKSTYKTKTTDGKVVEHNIKADSPQVKTVRNYVTHERYVTYEHRSSVFYGPYYGHPVYYNDCFSPFLMGWILSDAINSHERALWMYNHQNDMDQARYNELLRRDARLQAEIDQLKAQNAVRNAAYVPPQMADNPDVMYNKDFVDAAYNPVEKNVDSENAEHAESNSGMGWVCFLIFAGLSMTAVFAILVYVIFFKEFK